MHIYVFTPFDYDGRRYERGVHAIAPALADSFYIRGARPATAAEVAEVSPAAVETAAAAPETQTAAVGRNYAKRVKAGIS